MKKIIALLVMSVVLVLGACTNQEINQFKEEPNQIKDYTNEISKGKDVIEIFSDKIENKEDSEEIKQTLIEIKNEFKDEIQNIYYAMEDGRFILEPDVELPENYDARQRPWYQNGVKDKLYISEPYEDIVENRIIVSISKSVYKNEKLLGVIGIDIVVE